MASVFVFADHVKKVLDSGKKELEIPEGARISAAAYDIIRDNKIRITYVPAEVSSDDPKLPEAGEAPAALERSPDADGPSEPDDDPSETIRDAAGEIPEDVLEEIVDRVIKRFKRLQGSKAEASPAEADTGIEVGAEDSDDDDLVICRCEEITKGEIKKAIRNGMQTLNGIKRVTRAGMGLCQGQTCQRLVTQILSEELGLAAADIDPTTARGPVRPLRLQVFANS
jgi:bacterioferritin-associated ferredoxin